MLTDECRTAEFDEHRTANSNTHKYEHIHVDYTLVNGLIVRDKQQWHGNLFRRGSTGYVFGCFLPVYSIREKNKQLYFVTYFQTLFFINTSMTLYT